MITSAIWHFCITEVCQMLVSLRGILLKFICKRTVFFFQVQFTISEEVSVIILKTYMKSVKSLNKREIDKR